MKKINNEKLLKEIEDESSEIDSKSLGEIISEEKKIRDKTSGLNLDRFGKLLKQLQLAMSLIKDYKSRKYTDIPWRSITMIAASILYFINPFDMVPDMLPLFGIADDAMLFATLFKSIQIDLIRYGKWKGIDAKEFF